MESSDNGNIPWDEVIKKEARGIDDYSLGEVQASNFRVRHNAQRNSKYEVVSNSKAFGTRI